MTTEEVARILSIASFVKAEFLREGRDIFCPEYYEEVLRRFNNE